MDKEEFKETATAALSMGVAIAKKVGNVACELGKEGVAVAKAKAQEMREAREAQKAKEAVEPATADALLAGLSGFVAAEKAPSQTTSEQSRQGGGMIDLVRNASRQMTPATSSFDGASESQDVKFFIRGWLYAVYWVANIVDTILGIGCISIFGVKDGYYRGQYELNWTAIFIIVPIYLFLVLMNRIWYEIGIAIFEAVKHLRQIRDELRKANSAKA